LFIDSSIFNNNRINGDSGSAISAANVTVTGKYTTGKSVFSNNYGWDDSFVIYAEELSCKKGYVEFPHNNAGKDSNVDIIWF
jgi:hypothetical protein